MMPLADTARCFFLLAGLFVVVASGCERSESPSRKISTPTAAQPATAARTIALLGDNTRLDLLATIASAMTVNPQSIGDHRQVVGQRGKHEYRFIAAEHEGAAAQARVASQADMAILVVDATQGPLPIHREHVVLARQMNVPELRVTLTRTDLLSDDPELLELEELELRELLNMYVMDGDNARFAMDGTKAKATQKWKGARGADQLVDSLAGIAARPIQTLGPAHQHFAAELYVLGTEQTFVRNVAAPIRPGSVTLLIADEHITAQLDTSQPIAPLQNALVDVEFPAAVQYAPGQRFVLVRDDHVTAVGVLSDRR